MKFQVLDVGCGNIPHGDVNIDLYIKETGHRLGERLDVKKIPNYICADACHLPFKNNSFDLVYSSHTIEHVDNPILMMKEMLRVSKDRAYIRCPHRWTWRTHRKALHKHTFNATWFSDAFKTLKVEGKVDIVWKDILQLGFLRVSIFQKPAELEVVMSKLGRIERRHPMEAFSRMCSIQRR